MSDSEIVVLRAELDAAKQRIADLESEHDTIPCKPLEDTGPISAHDVIKAQAAICLQDAFDQLAETQKTLEIARFKTDLALGMTADDEAHRTPTRMERIEAKLEALEQLVAGELSGLRAELASVEQAVHAASANINTLVGTLQPFGTRLTQLESAHARHHPIALVVAAPPSSRRPGTLENDAQEG